MVRISLHESMLQHYLPFCHDIMSVPTNSLSYRQLVAITVVKYTLVVVIELTLGLYSIILHGQSHYILTIWKSRFLLANPYPGTRLPTAPGLTTDYSPTPFSPFIFSMH